METREIPRYHTISSMQLETDAKQPFIKPDKRGELSLTVGPEVWNTLENMTLHATKKHPKFKGLWKTIIKHHPEKENLTVMHYNLRNLYFLLEYAMVDEIRKWIDGILKDSNYQYILPHPKHNFTNE